MDYDQQAAYEAPPRPPVPVLWIGLTGVFALCCCFFFVVSGAEAMLLAGGGLPAGSPAATPAPAIGEIKFYLDKSAAGAPSGAAVTSVPTTTKAVYAFFTFKNMPKTGLTWSYVWQYNGADFPSATKTDQRWTKEGSGTLFVPLADDKGLKPGDYDLSLQLNGQEVQAGTIHVGP